MTAERLDKLRNARKIPEVTLQKYNQLRSKHANDWIFAFEGFDDVTFYATIIDKINNINFVPFVCKGKDQVLQFRELLSRNVSNNKDRVRYFVDADFDGLKGYVPSDDIYCTPTYSFENLLVDIEILPKLLTSEFRCNDENAEREISHIIDTFEKRSEEFIQLIEKANFLLFYGRRSCIKLKSVDNDLKKYVSVSIDELSSGSSDSPFHTLVGFEEAPDEEMLAEAKGPFSSLNPLNDWRGKFWYAFFLKFLQDLKEDRGSKTPRHFSNRANMSFAPNGDIIRCLASMIKPPENLKKFILNMPNIEQQN